MNQQEIEEMEAFRVKAEGNTYPTRRCVVIADNIREARRVFEKRFPTASILAIEKFDEDILIQVYEN